MFNAVLSNRRDIGCLSVLGSQAIGFPIGILIESETEPLAQTHGDMLETCCRAELTTYLHSVSHSPSEQIDNLTVLLTVMLQVAMQVPTT